MYEFQDEGIAWLGAHAHALLGDEPGLGKTRQLLLAAEGSTIAVVPAMLEGVWRKEHALWRPDLQLDIIPYSSLCAREKTARGGSATLPVLRPELRGLHYDTGIFDEGHYLKGRKTDWTKAAKQLQLDRRWLATGTPIPNWADEVFMIAQILHPGDRRFTNYWKWVERWFEVKAGYRNTMKVAGLRPDRTWEQFNAENLDLMLRRTWDQVNLQLPPMRHQTIEVQMTPKQRRFYTALKKDYTAWLPEGREVVCWSAGALSVRLLQSATALETIDPTARGGSGKLAMLEQLLSDWGGQPALVVCHFRETASAIAGVCERLKLPHLLATGVLSPKARYAVAERFQAGEAAVLVATIESIAHGLTLTRADRIVFVERSYRPSYNEQVRRRILRIGQSRPTLRVDLVTKDSVDERVVSLLERKTDQQMQALGARELASLL